MNRKPRILFIVPSDYDSLKEKGVLWMIKDREENGFFEKVFTLHPLVRKSREINIGLNNKIIEFGRDKIPLLNVISRDGYYLELAKAILSFPLLVSSMYSFIKRHRINIIRATDPYLTGFIALILSKMTRVPFCVSLHSDYDKCYELDNVRGAPVYFGSREVAKQLERFILSHCPMVMPISEYLQKYAVTNGAKPDSIRIIPHGLDMMPFLEQQDRDFKKKQGMEGKKVVTFVGRLCKENYIYDVIEIAEKIKKSSNKVVFLIIGSGKEEGRVKLKVADKDLNDNFKFLGFQPHEKVPYFILNTDVNLCPLSGFSLIEAAASGKPIVAYDIEWHYELVKNNETGFLVPKGDIVGAANAILKLLDNPDLARRLGENARKLAIKRHSLENTSKIKVKWYEELISG